MKKNQTRYQRNHKPNRPSKRTPTSKTQNNQTPRSERFMANVTRAFTVARSKLTRSERRAQRQLFAAKAPEIIKAVHQRKPQPRMRTLLRQQGYRYNHDQAAWVEV